MKLQGISKEGMKRLAKKVKGQDDYLQQVAPGLAEDEALNKIVDYLQQHGEMSGMDIVNDLGVDEVDVHMALQEGAIKYCPAPAGGGGSWYCVASKRPRRAQDSNPVKEYWGTVKAIAQDIKDEYKQYGDTDVEELIVQHVDGSEYIIYYHKNLEVLQNSDNADAIDEVGAEIDTSKGWQNILTQVAFYAMEADVRDALADIGYGTAAWQGGFDDDEEEDF